MVVLDTSFLADYSRRVPGALDFLKQLAREEARISTTSITVGELYKGAYGHARTAEKLKEVELTLEGLVLLEVTLEAARNYGLLFQQLRRKGRMVGDRDLWIASTALAYGESKVVTRNVKDFEKIPGIVVVSY